ncbi:MAG: formylglycine-generating enzyme family protein, partial [Kiritimatiellae bacterium]|nr:formylglycine-generating enzyme family protein [Kiritimatiellia bacterium]
GCFRAVVKAWPTNSPPDYWALDLSGGKCHFYYPDADCLPEGIDSDKWRMEQMLMRRIPARNVVWQMGSPENELGRDTSTTYGANMEKQHKVKLTHDYYLGVFEVTQYQMEVARAGSPNASKFTNSLHWATRPAEYTNFADRYHENTDPTSSDSSVRHSCLNWKVTGTMRNRTGLNYYLDLPTEAQWEFACRAGSTNALYDGNELSMETGEDANLSKLARYKYTVEDVNADYSCSTNSGTARVGTYAPNDWGLYDMLGNVAEMCLDCYGSYTNFTDEISVDPLGPKFCGTVPHDTYPAMHRVIRGGSYQSTAAGCRTSSRAREQIWTSSSSTGARMCYTLVNDDIVIEGSLSESVPLATSLVSPAHAPSTAEGSSTLRCVPYGGRVTVR